MSVSSGSSRHSRQSKQSKTHKKRKKKHKSSRKTTRFQSEHATPSGSDGVNLATPEAVRSAKSSAKNSRKPMAPTQVLPLPKPTGRQCVFNFSGFFNSKLFADVIFEFKGSGASSEEPRRIYAHRMLLGLESEVLLQAMQKKAPKNGYIRFAISNVDHSVFETFVRYFYERAYNNETQNLNLDLNLLRVAMQFKVQPLVEQCNLQIRQQMDVARVGTVMTHACVEPVLKDLQQHCLSFIRGLNKRQFERVLQEKDERDRFVVNTKIATYLLKEIRGGTWDALLTEAVAVSRPDVLKLFLSDGADVNMRDPVTDETLLHRAAALDSGLCCKLLIDAKADCNTNSKTGITVLHRAAEAGAVAAAELLMQQKAAPDVPNMKGQTALHMLATAYSEENKMSQESHKIVELLLTYKANVGVRDMDGRTPLHIAAQKASVTLVGQMLATENAVTPRNTSFRASSHTENLATTNLRNETPLHAAMQAERHTDAVAVCKMLVDAFQRAVMSEPRLKEYVSMENVDGDTPLHICAGRSRRGTRGIMDVLIYSRADPNAMNKRNGYNPLHSLAVFSSMDDHTQVVELLVSHGCDINAVSPVNGNSALHFAVSRNNVKLAVTLLKHGAVGNILNHKRQSPLDQVVEGSRTETQLLTNISTLRPLADEKEILECMLCRETKFSFSRKRHRCRHCGFIVCRPCIDKATVAKFNGVGSRPVKVCSRCARILRTYG